MRNQRVGDLKEGQVLVEPGFAIEFEPDLRLRLRLRIIQEESIIGKLMRNTIHADDADKH
jgi:hypothetical protein